MMNRMESGRTIITLDGPAASGKSSVARRVAQSLDIPFVSSGLFYRTATALVLDHGIDPAAERDILTLIGRHRVRLEPDADGNHVFVDDHDVTDSLHTDRVDEAVSGVSRHPGLRIWVRDRLREIPGSFVIEGRDMGTVVFPEAEHKFYLTAPAAVRARRRVGERDGDLAATTDALERRDDLDRRQLAPAEDAIFVETGELTLDQVVGRVMAHLTARAAGARSSPQRST